MQRKNGCFYILLTLACLVQSLCLLNNGIFWDDWVTLSISHEGLLTTYYTAGFPLTAHVHDVIRSWGPLGYRTIVLICLFVMTLCFYYSLRKLRILKDYQVQILTLFFLVAPLNLAKWSAINCPAMIHTTLFFIGTYLFVSLQSNHRWWVRILSLMLLFLSFSINSILLFYYFVFAAVLISTGVFNKDIKSWKVIIQKFPDFILLPIVYWIFKKIFFVSYGNYVNYNAVTLSSLIKGIIKSYKLLWFSWIEPIWLSFVGGFLLGVLFLVLAWYFWSKKRISKIESAIQDKHIFYVGLILFLVAGIPYLAVGKLPRMDDWHSRHQLLMPIGFALMTFGALEILFKKYALLAHYFFIGCFVGYIAYNQIEYIQDHLKQEAVMKLLSEVPQLQNEKVFIFDDRAKEWNVFAREIRFYEFSGWFRKMYGDQTRYGVLKENKEAFDKLDLGFIAEEYNLKDFKDTGRRCELTIKSDGQPNFLEVLFNRKKLEKRIALDSINCYSI